MFFMLCHLKSGCHAKFQEAKFQEIVVRRSIIRMKWICILHVRVANLPFYLLHFVDETKTWRIMRMVRYESRCLCLVLIGLTTIFE